MKMPFEILINDRLLSELIPTSTLTPISNKSVLSIVNDYEDNEWRYKKFHQYIWDNISQEALTIEERESLIDSPNTILERAASRLRIIHYKETGEVEKLGGEIAEILLYGIMRHYYNALPVVPKIFYKQNKNDYAKGADSVHIVLEGDDKFSLWLGEAKFYKRIENSNLDTIVSSVYETLSTDKIKKENSIITGLSEFDKYDIEESVKRKIKSLLDEDTSIDNIKPILHVPIILLHECKITADTKIMTKVYIDQIVAKHIERAESYFSKQIEKCKGIAKYAEIKFHLILFPVPNKEHIVDRFIKRAKELRDE